VRLSRFYVLRDFTSKRDITAVRRSVTNAGMGPTGTGSGHRKMGTSVASPSLSSPFRRTDLRTARPCGPDRLGTRETPPRRGPLSSDDRCRRALLKHGNDETIAHRGGLPPPYTPRCRVPFSCRPRQRPALLATRLLRTARPFGSAGPGGTVDAKPLSGSSRSSSVWRYGKVRVDEGWR
jgi:hypothetical protein